MPVSWNEIQKEMYPIKDYGDLCRRWQEAFTYLFVCDTYNFRNICGEKTHGTVSQNMLKG